MKTLFVAAIMAVASPAFAQSAEPTCPHCEQAEMGCCEKDQDGKMRCKMMDHGFMRKLSLVLSLLQRLKMRMFENKKRVNGERDDRLQAHDADNLGDDDPRFRFTY